MTKSFLASKTFWATVLGLLIALAAIFGIQPVDAANLPQWAQALIAVANGIAIVLARSVAKGPLTASTKVLAAPKEVPK
jgi:uncharacterized membrane protein (DUF441 family)